MKIGIFGGTFDPFHIGHTGMLESASKSMLFDKIYVIPSANPPHKDNNSITMASYRYKMASIALEDGHFETPVILNDIELKSEGPSYTLETVRRIKETETEPSTLALICGSDIIFDIDKWYKPDELLREVEIFVALRPGFDNVDLTNKVKFLEDEFEAKIEFFDADYIDISSNQIRGMITSGTNEESNYLQPDVYKWVMHNKIYGYGDQYSYLNEDTIVSIIRYEKTLRKYLSEERLIHSLNTMREAIKLSVMYDVDPNKAAISGILHDCAKFETVNEEIEKIVDANVSSIDVPTTKNIKAKKLQIDSDTHTATVTNTECESKISQKVREYFDFDIECVPYKILHAYLGRTIASKLYGITDEDILNSVYYHTTSRYNSTVLEKIIFIADKIEAARDFPRIDEIRKIAYNDMNKGHYECLKDIIKALKNKNVEVHSDTMSAYEQHK